MSELIRRIKLNCNRYIKMHTNIEKADQIIYVDNAVLNVESSIGGGLS